MKKQHAVGRATRAILALLLVSVISICSTQAGLADILGTGSNPSGNPFTGWIAGIGPNGSFQLPPLAPPLPQLPPGIGGAALFDDLTYSVAGVPVNMVELGAGTVTFAGTFTAPAAPLAIHLESVDPMTGFSNGVLSFDANGTYLCAPPPAGCFGAAVSFVTTLSNGSGSLLNQFPDSSSFTYTLDGSVTCIDCMIGSTGAGEPPTDQTAIFAGPFVVNAFPPLLPPTATPQPGAATATPTLTFLPGTTPPPTPTSGPNTQPGSDVSLSGNFTFVNPITNDPVSVSVDVNFSQVSGAGATTVTAFSNAAGALAANFSVGVDGYQATFVDVSTSATVSGPITICSSYPDANSDGFVDGTGNPPSDPGVSVTSLRILHREDVNGVPTFVDRTVSPIDVANHKICAQTTSLSPFVVAVNTSIPGGGSAKTDCVSEWLGGSNVKFSKKGQPNTTLTCKDGQGSCDTDSTTGQCTFSIGICPNPTDARLSKCVPSNIATYTLAKPLPYSKDGIDAANASNILAQIELLGANAVSGKHQNTVTFNSPVTATTCLNPISVTVPLKRNGKAGNKVLSLKAATSSGVVDTDTLKLICNP